MKPNPLIIETVLYSVSQGKTLKATLAELGNPIDSANWWRWCEADPDLKAKWRALEPWRNAGRPALVTPDVVDEVCYRLSQGEPLAQICRDPHMPDDNTIRVAAKKDETIASRIAQAREAGEERIIEDCLEIADDARNDWMEKVDKDGQSVGWAVNGEHIQRSKLRVETRLKLLAKWNPKKWGDQQKIEHSGNSSKPVTLQILTSVPEPEPSND